MTIQIPLKDKKKFIRWFLKHYELKKRECNWILEYLLTDTLLLNNVHFVTQAEHCPRAIIMSTVCSDEISFRFHKKHVITIDLDKSFHDLRLNKHRPMYMQINFYNSNQHPLYIAILEENPFVPEHSEIKRRDWMVAEQILEKTLIESRRALLKKQIDHSLAENNREDFYKLVEELNTLDDQSY